MVAFFDALSAFVAMLLGPLLLLAGLALAGTGGVLVAAFTNRNWLGWMSGFLLLIIVWGALIPIVDALKQVECKNAQNFDDCVEGENEYARDG